MTIITEKTLEEIPAPEADNNHSRPFDDAADAVPCVFRRGAVLFHFRR